MISRKILCTLATVKHYLHSIQYNCSLLKLNSLIGNFATKHFNSVNVMLQTSFQNSSSLKKF